MNPAQLLAHFDRISEGPDAIPRIRRFILDLAVRGKLVEQEPEDEPASVLLKRIDTLKVRLIKEGKIRKQQPPLHVEIKDQPFKIPTGWQWVRFGAIADFSAGRTPSRHDFSFWNTGDYAWVSIADMKDGADVVTTKETVSERAKKYVFCSDPAPVGTLIMSFKLTIGKISRLGVPAFHNEAIISIHPLLPEMDTYLFKVLPRFSREGNTKDAIKGATLNRDSLTNILLPLPPLAEQQRLVAKVNELMVLCDRLEAAQAERESRRDRLVAASLQRLNQPAGAASAFHEHARFHLCHFPRLTTRAKHIQQLRHAILNLAIRGRLVLQDPNDEPAAEILARIKDAKKQLSRGGKAGNTPSALKPNELSKVPPGWQAVRFQEILLTLQTGPFGSSLHQHDYEEGGIPVINPASIQNERIVPIDKMAVGRKTFERLATFKLQKNDVVMGRRGEMGRCAVVTEKEAGWLCGTGSLILRFTEDISPWFIAKLMAAPSIREYLRGASVGATMQNLNQSILCGMIIGLPPLAEQHRIVTKVEELLALCNRLEVQLTTSQTESRHLLEAILHETLNLGLPENVSKREPTYLKPETPQESAATGRRPNRHFLRAVLSAEIVHALHAEPTFGRIKHQKILHLCEHIAQIDGVSGEYRREAAGPLDNKMIYSVEAELKKQRWYEEYRRERFGHAYRPLEKAGGHRKYLGRYWSDKLPIIQRLLEMMRTWDTDRCEIFSTTYAAWNDLLIWKKEPTDEAILKEILERWHERKQRIPDERWRKTIAWMRKEGFVPTGFGKETRHY